MPPTRRTLFLGPNGLHSGWRLALHIVLLLITIGLSVAVLLPLGPLFSELGVVWSFSDPWLPLALYALLILPLFAITAASGWLLDQRGPTSAGLGLQPLRTSMELAGGALTGLAMLALALGLMAAGTEVTIDTRPLQGGVGLWAAWLVFFFLAASLEELVFRGYAFVWAIRSLHDAASWALGRVGLWSRTSRWAVWALATVVVTLISALIFGLLHNGNEGATAISRANTALAGLLFAVLILRSRSLWPAISLHWGWNIGQNLIMGLPVSGAGSEGSGMSFPSPLFTTFSGPDWLAGGAYGVEGSVACTAAMTVGLLGCLIWPRRPGDLSIEALVYPKEREELEAGREDRPPSAR